MIIDSFDKKQKYSNVWLNKLFCNINTYRNGTV